MTALNKARIHTTHGGSDVLFSYNDFPVAANVVIFPGALVVLRSGYLRPGAANQPGDIACGRADIDMTLDTTGLADGAKRCRVCSGLLRWDNGPGGDAATAADLGAFVYVLDDQTITRNGGGAVAGRLFSLEANGSVFVLTHPAIVPAPPPPPPPPSPPPPSFFGGRATLVGGAVTVGIGDGLPYLHSFSRILVTRMTPEGTVGNLSVPSASRVTTPGAQAFVINSDSATETSTVEFLVYN